MSVFAPARIGRLTLDPNDCSMAVGKVGVRLSAHQWRIVLALAEARGERVGSERMFAALWGEPEDGGPEAPRTNLRVLIYKMRRKFRASGLGIVILSDRARNGTGDSGYRLDPEVVR